MLSGNRTYKYLLDIELVIKHHQYFIKSHIPNQAQIAQSQVKDSILKKKRVHHSFTH